MSVSYKLFSLSFALRAWAKCRIGFLNVLTPDFQSAESLFLTRCKGTKNWWMGVGHWQTLSHIVSYCRLLAVIGGNGVKNVRKFLA